MIILKTRQRLFAILIGCIALVNFSSCSLPKDNQVNNQPNIVLFIGDDISVDDFGCYGHPNIKTPNINKLADQGVLFSNAYLTTSSCSPTRTSLITGRYPHNTGAPELHMTDSPYLENIPQFPNKLREIGYYSALAGKVHFNGDVSKSFDKIHEDKQPSGSSHWVTSLQERPMDKPFFMWFASKDAHRGWDQNLSEGPHKPEDAIIPPYHYDGEMTRKDYAHYYNEIFRLDYNIGQVVDELKKQNVYDNTIIIFMADNGRAFPRDKENLYDSGIKTPLIIHAPKKWKEAIRVDGLVSIIDLAPTILNLVGLKYPNTFQGRSLLPMLQNPESEICEMVFAERNWHVLRNHERMVRSGNFVYIKNNISQYERLSIKNKGSSGSYKDLIENKKKRNLSDLQNELFVKPRPEEELYDVLADPHQVNNLVKDLHYEKELIKLRSLLDQWTSETGDTLPDLNEMTLDRRERETWKSYRKELGDRPSGGVVPGYETQAWIINNSGPR